MTDSRWRRPGGAGTSDLDGAGRAISPPAGQPDAPSAPSPSAPSGMAPSGTRAGNGAPAGPPPGPLPSQPPAGQWAIAGVPRRILALVACLLLAVAAGLAAIVAGNPARPPLAGVDRGWGSLLRTTREAGLTDIAKGFSYLAGPLGGSIIAVAVALFLWFARKRKVAAVFAAITPVLASGASQLIKHLVQRTRPAGGLVGADFGSFPSGHVITALAVSLALTLVLARPGHRRWALAAVGAATLVMIWCRTYLGVHWLSDTLESLFVAGGLVLALWAILGGRIAREAAGARDGPDPRPPSPTTPAPR